MSLSVRIVDKDKYDKMRDAASVTKTSMSDIVDYVIERVFGGKTAEEIAKEFHMWQADKLDKSQNQQ